MTQFLTFTAYGPLAAWGNIAVGERRTVDAQPSRSALVGWLSGALGLRRDDKRIGDIAHGYKFATLLDNTGTLLSDYHTTQRPAASAYGRKGVPTTRRDALLRDKQNTTLSRREYACDSLAFIAVWGTPQAPYPLSELQTALSRPSFEPYLGRKSCPLAWPLRATLREGINPEQVLREQAADPLVDELVRKPMRDHGALDAQVRLFWEGEWPELEPHGTQVRRDMPVDRRGWYFTERHEHFRTIPRESP